MIKRTFAILLLAIAIGFPTAAMAPLTPTRCMKVFGYATFGGTTEYLDWHQVCSRGRG